MNKKVIAILFLIMSCILAKSQDKEIDYKKGEEYRNDRYTLEYLGEINGKFYSHVVDFKNNNPLKEGFYINEFTPQMKLIGEYKVPEIYKSTVWNLLKIVIVGNEFVIFSTLYSKKEKKLIAYFGKARIKGKKVVVDNWIPLKLDSYNTPSIYFLPGAANRYIENQNVVPFSFVLSPDKSKILVGLNQAENKFMQFSVVDLDKMEVILNKTKVDVRMMTENERGKFAVDNQGNAYLIDDEYLIEDSKGTTNLWVFAADESKGFIKLNLENSDYKPIYSQVYIDNSNQVIINGLARNTNTENLFDAVYFSVFDTKSWTMKPAIYNEISGNDKANLFKDLNKELGPKRKVRTFVKFQKIQDLEEGGGFFQVIEFEFNTMFKLSTGEYDYERGGNNFIATFRFSSEYELEFLNLIKRPFEGYGIQMVGNNDDYNCLITKDNIYLFYNVIYEGERKPETILVKINSVGESKKYNLGFLNDDGFISTSESGLIGNTYIFEQMNKKNVREVFIKI